MQCYFSGQEVKCKAGVSDCYCLVGEKRKESEKKQLEMSFSALSAIPILSLEIFLTLDRLHTLMLSMPNNIGVNRIEQL